MQAERSTILQRHIDLTTYNAIHAAAAARGVTMAVVVDALLGRPASEEAVLAGLTVSVAPSVLDRLRTSWPYECQFCTSLLAANEFVSCPFDNAPGCTTCVTGKGCPPCAIQRAAAADERRRLAAANEPTKE